jgi:hypothetical protein
LGFRQEIGGPEAGETASHYRDVGCDVFLQGWAVWAGLVGEGLAQPPAALGAGLEGVPDEIKVRQPIS